MCLGERLVGVPSKYETLQEGFHNDFISKKQPKETLHLSN